MSLDTTPTPTIKRPIFDTENSLEQDTRTRLVQVLNQRLADAIDLQLQAKIAHWNVRGPNFMQLHELFDRVYDRAREHSDLIAERIGQLGGLAEVNVQTVAARSELDIYPTDNVGAMEHVKLVAKALAAFGSMGRKAIDTASETGDEITADILTEVTRSSDKMLWFVEAHLQA